MGCCILGPVRPDGCVVFIKNAVYLNTDIWINKNIRIKFFFSYSFQQVHLEYSGTLRQPPFVFLQP